MTAADLSAVLKGIAPVVREFIGSSVESLVKRLETLEARPIVQAKDGIGIGSLTISADGRLLAHLTDGRALDAGPVPIKEGPAGKDVDSAVVSELKAELGRLRGEFSEKRFHPEPEHLKSMVTAEIAKLPPAQNGKDADPAVIERMVAERVALIPRPLDGKDVSQAEVKTMIEDAVLDAVAALPRPKDGISVGLADVEPVIYAAVKKAVEALPPARDGNSVDPADIEAMVSKAVALVPKPKDGTDGTSVSLDQVATLAAVEVKKAVDAIPRPQDGRSVDLAEVDTLVASHVQKAVAGLPVPKDGDSVTAADVAPLIAQEVEKAVAAIPRAKDGAPGQVGPVGPSGADGKSLSLDDIAPLLTAEVKKAVSVIPAPRDGSSVTLTDVEPLIRAEVHKAVAALPRAKDGADGVGLTGGVISQDGSLVLTLSDGTVKPLGEVVGRSVDMAVVQKSIEEQVALIPRPKDGKDGKDGVDGFGFDDYEEASDGERTVTRRFKQGDRVKEFTHKLPAVIYRGVWSEGKTYERGDSVTFGGCQWIAKEETTVKPDFTPVATKVWVLSVKEGRKGKDADPALIETMVNKAVAKIPKPKEPQK